MDSASTDGPGQAGVGADEKADTPAATKGGEPFCQGTPIRIIVVAKDNRRAARQGDNGGGRIGQSRTVGHEDEARHATNIVSARQIEPSCQVC